MHPSCLHAVVLHDNCIGDCKFVLCAELELEAPLVVANTNTVFSMDAFPCLRFATNSSVEVSRDQDHVICRGVI